MKTFLYILLSFIPILSLSQTCTTTVAYDYMEVYTWFGNWNTVVNTGFYINASVTPTLSGVLYGAGNGSSAIESANYVLPNITGLNPTSTHVLRFRLASYRFSNPAAATAGVDGADYVDVRYSTNNLTYITEMRITGNANAYWNYNTLATASKTVTGANTTYAPTGGGNRTATGDGYSTIELTIPPGPTQLAFQLGCRINSAGEEWWIDNVELLEIAPCSPLPIELVEFNGINNNDHNIITWVTVTEINNDYYTLERSTDGFNWFEINVTDGAGNSLTPILYSYKDYNYNKNSTNYYRLKQTDFNGVFKYFNIIYITNDTPIKPKLLTIYNYIGQEVNNSATGFLIEVYDDGSTKKIYKSN
jgi:hypothetical protein